MSGRRMLRSAPLHSPSERSSSPDRYRRGRGPGRLWPRARSEAGSGPTGAARPPPEVPPARPRPARALLLQPERSRPGAGPASAVSWQRREPRAGVTEPRREPPLCACAAGRLPGRGLAPVPVGRWRRAGCRGAGVRSLAGPFRLRPLGGCRAARGHGNLGGCARPGPGRPEESPAAPSASRVRRGGKGRAAVIRGHGERRGEPAAPRPPAAPGRAGVTQAGRARGLSRAGPLRTVQRSSGGSRCVPALRGGRQRPAPPRLVPERLGSVVVQPSCLRLSERGGYTKGNTSADLAAGLFMSKLSCGTVGLHALRHLLPQEGCVSATGNAPKLEDEG